MLFVSFLLVRLTCAEILTSVGNWTEYTNRLPGMKKCQRTPVVRSGIMEILFGFTLFHKTNLAVYVTAYYIWVSGFLVMLRTANHFILIQ